MIKNPSWGNFGFLAWDAAAFCVPCLPGSYVLKGVGVAAKASKGIGIAKYTKGTAGQIGRIGEKLSGIIKNTKTIIMNGRRRIPDAYDVINKTLEEVKNVKNLSLTGQLKDDMEDCELNNYSMILHIRPNTYMSKPLKKAIQKYGVEVKYLW